MSGELPTIICSWFIANNSKGRKVLRGRKQSQERNLKERRLLPDIIARVIWWRSKSQINEVSFSDRSTDTTRSHGLAVVKRDCWIMGPDQ